MASASSFDMKSMNYPNKVLENIADVDSTKPYVSAKELNPWFSIDFNDELVFDNVILLGFLRH